MIAAHREKQEHRTADPRLIDGTSPFTPMRAGISACTSGIVSAPVSVTALECGDSGGLAQPGSGPRVDRAAHVHHEANASRHCTGIHGRGTGGLPSPLPYPPGMRLPKTPVPYNDVSRSTTENRIAEWSLLSRIRFHAPVPEKNRAGTPGNSHLGVSKNIQAENTCQKMR